MSVASLSVSQVSSCSSSDVDEYFRELGLSRTHSHVKETRKPASLRGPLAPLVLDEVAQKQSSRSEVKLVAELLETIAAANGRVAEVGKLSFRSDFECVTAPSLSITAYIKQLSQLCSTVWAAVLSMLDRVGRYAGMPFTPLTAHRLIVAAFGLVTKDHADAAKQLSKVAGVTSVDQRKMEQGLLKLLETASGEDDCSWDALIGLHDAPAIQGALAKAVRSAQKDHARRLMAPPSSPVYILPSYLDCPSSGCTSGTASSLSVTSSQGSSTSFGRRLTEAKLFASQEE